MHAVCKSKSVFQKIILKRILDIDTHNAQFYREMLELYYCNLLSTHW